jgi:hypothetical protein
MGKYKNGINGSFSGKIGTVVGATSRGIAYMRSVPDARVDKPTPAQQNHRDKFGMVSSWFKPLKSILEVGMQHHTGIKTPMNLAISLNFKHAVTIEDQRFKLDFSKVILSTGSLFISIITEVTTISPGKIKVRWIDANPSVFCKGDDKATFVFYSEHTGKYLTFTGIADRADHQAMIDLPEAFAGGMVHCWMQYVNVEGDEVSTTVYVAGIEIP